HLVLRKETRASGYRGGRSTKCASSRGQVVASCNISWDNGNPAGTNDLRHGSVLQLQFLAELEPESLPCIRIQRLGGGSDDRGAFRTQAGLEALLPCRWRRPRFS